MKLYADHAPGVRFTNQHLYAVEHPKDLPEHVNRNPNLRKEPYLGYLEDAAIKASVDKSGYMLFYRRELHVMRGELRHWAYEYRD